MPDPQLTLDSVVIALTVLATSVMALTGAIQAVRNEFDPFGAAVLALATAVGGGTLRDLLLGATPVFWMTNLVFVATALPVGLIGYVIGSRLAAGGGRRLRILNYIDAVGLALFTLLGLQKALAFGVSPVIAVILGCITGIAGGMIRDILCGEQPIVLKKDLYATISLLGGGLYLALAEVLPEQVSSVACFTLIVLVRWRIIHRRRDEMD